MSDVLTGASWGAWFLPAGIVYANFIYTNNGARAGVYQALSTPSGGEVVSADSY